MKAVILMLMLTGCASTPTGVQMTDAERAACEQGYEAGRKSL